MGLELHPFFLQDFGILSRPDLFLGLFQDWCTILDHKSKSGVKTSELETETPCVIASVVQ